MCGIEKNAITLMNALVHTVLDLPPWKSGTEFWFRASPDMLDVSANRARELLHDPSWRSAVVYRDPVERFVSAYKSKCELSDKDGREHCHKVFQTARPKPQLVADALLSVSRAPPAPRCTRFDPHWAPQACFCTGLAETFPLYSHPIEFQNLTSGLEAFFRGRVNESVLERVRTLLRDRRAVTDGSPEQGEHLTGEQGGLSGHEMMQIRAQLREVYREDYAVLPCPATPRPSRRSARSISGAYPGAPARRMPGRSCSRSHCRRSRRHSRPSRRSRSRSTQAPQPQLQPQLPQPQPQPPQPQPQPQPQPAAAAATAAGRRSRRSRSSPVLICPQTLLRTVFACRIPSLTAGSRTTCPKEATEADCKSAVLARQRARAQRVVRGL